MWSAPRKMFSSCCPPAANNAVGMIVLQSLRICTVITLLVMCMAYWVVIIKVDKSRTYFVFECASLCFSSILCLVLSAAEFPVHPRVRGYFRSTWPVLSEAHGVGYMGAAILLLGCNMLGELNRPDNEGDKLTPPLFNLALAAGVLAFIFGVLNIVCALVWRNKGEGITSRDIRADGALAKGRRSSLPGYSSSASSCYGKKETVNWNGPKARDANDKKHKQSARPAISPPVDLESGHDEKDRYSPLAPEIQRPDTAMHPINLNTSSATSSRYSAADMNQI
ncbi:uncharacterized protein MAM_04149 [Metarhizium album ARSEF 1941]|uniref:DUF7598 domain-containing protein n=1 Tax=Metarhizium album (strain ARSEF 1941) TaxID=1081103 RepID=A0A0B2WY60_METAS|nr:uncharacterized protein MAM_04149 [Metarhizium album ARSEF 1941]KHN97760.1 hypothetical protein MAM_04149 [Metarhizium album ARSEF 1941]